MVRRAGGASRRWINWAGPGQLILAMAMLCVFAAAALAQGQGIGGTGYQPGEGNGIGGTGAPQSQATGIVGTITGFGSILVNNYEVDYSAETQTKSDLDDVHEAKALRIGQVVEIEADGQGQRVRARRIAVRYEVAGPIEFDRPRRGNHPCSGPDRGCWPIGKYGIGFDCKPCRWRYGQGERPEAGRPGHRCVAYRQGRAWKARVAARTSR